MPNINVVYRTDVHGIRLLTQAIENCHVSVVGFFLSLPRIDCNSKDAENFTPLHDAVFFDKADIVELLLAQPKIKVNERITDSETPLIMAVNAQQIKIVELLAAFEGIDLEVKNFMNWTALDHAARNGDVDSMVILLSHGAKISDTTHNVARPEAKELLDKIKAESVPEIDAILTKYHDRLISYKPKYEAAVYIPREADQARIVIDAAFLLSKMREGVAIT